MCSSQKSVQAGAPALLLVLLIVLDEDDDVDEEELLVVVDVGGKVLPTSVEVSTSSDVVLELVGGKLP